MRLFPGIGFRGRPRRAWVIGTGLDVWELMMIVESFDDDAEQILLNYPLVSERTLRIGKAYAERFPEEIEHYIAATRRPLEELRELYPLLSFGD
jgi:hypothetical protein